MKKFGRYILSLTTVFIISSTQFVFASSEYVEYMQDARKIFHQIDFNKDGKISPLEYFTIEEARLGYRTHLTNIWKSLDTNNDGTVSIEEYFGKTETSRDISFSYEGKIEERIYWFIEILDYPQYQKHLVSYFDILDKDNDGLVSLEEYINTFIGYNGKKLTKVGEEYASALDTNQDNKISRKEFLNFDFKMPNIERFDKLDFNKDNYISENEFVKFMNMVLESFSNW